MNKIWLVVLVTLLSTSCSSVRMETAAPQEPANLTDTELYKIGIGDGLSISVWRNPELSVNVPVRPDGMISVPLVGDIKAAGTHPEELSQLLKNKLENFIRTPQVTVVVTNAASSEFLHRVRVTGAVTNPTSLTFQKGMTVMDVVLVSGGLTPFANPNEARLYRASSSGTKVYPIRMKDILEKGDIATNYKLAPGDIITVPERLF